MEDEKIQRLIKYWKLTAEHDYKTMLALFKSKRYSDSLFYGHIVLEKILKALVVQNTGNEAPKIHDLFRLAELSKQNLSNENLKYLKRVNRYNMRTRYPDEKLNFYKMCDFKYSKDNLIKIEKLYKELCQRLN